MARGIQLGIQLGLPRPAAATLAALRTPQRIQDFVNALVWNHEADGPTAHGVVEVLDRRQAHCIEGAFVAACALWLAGEPPLLMDMGAARGDVDHVVALFRRRGYWGAISKSNSPFLRYRDPIHRSLRELAISFFPQYVKRAAKRSAPIRCRSISAGMTRRSGSRTEASVTGWSIGSPARHFTLVPAGLEKELRPIDEIEARSNLLKDYPA